MSVLLAVGGYSVLHFSGIPFSSRLGSTAGYEVMCPAYFEPSTSLSFSFREPSVALVGFSSSLFKQGRLALSGGISYASYGTVLVFDGNDLLTGSIVPWSGVAFVNLALLLGKPEGSFSVGFSYGRSVLYTGDYYYGASYALGALLNRERFFLSVSYRAGEKYHSSSSDEKEYRLSSIFEVLSRQKIFVFRKKVTLMEGYSSLGGFMVGLSFKAFKFMPYLGFYRGVFLGFSFEGLPITLWVHSGELFNSYGVALYMRR